MPPRPQHTPSDLIHFMESEFITWMDRYHREHPGELTPDETDESLMILAKKGIEHEKDFLASLQDQGLDVCVIARGTNAPNPEANPETSPDSDTNPTSDPNPTSGNITNSYY